MVTEDTLPKYVKNANCILEFLVDQPNQVWEETQKELADRLGFSLAELSALIKTLHEAGKIKKGASLPGHRGRTASIHLVDATPFDTPIRRELNRRTDDRPLEPGEEVTGVIDLKSISNEQIGSAVVRMLQKQWTSEEHYSQVNAERLGKIREFREQLAEERQIRMRLVEERDNLRREVEEKATDLNNMRARLNDLLVKDHRSKDGRGTFQVRELLEEDELKTLEYLMRGKPGFYRESDTEVGVAAG